MFKKTSHCIRNLDIGHPVITISISHKLYVLFCCSGRIPRLSLIRHSLTVCLYESEYKETFGNHTKIPVGVFNRLTGLGVCLVLTTRYILATITEVCGMLLLCFYCDLGTDGDDDDHHPHLPSADGSGIRRETFSDGDGFILSSSYGELLT